MKVKMNIEEFVDFLKDYKDNVDCSSIRCEDCKLGKSDGEYDTCDRLMKLSNELNEGEEQ